MDNNFLTKSDIILWIENWAKKILVQRKQI